MAFNNGFPVNYSQYYPQNVYQNSNSIIWVQGEAGAKSYLVAPNTTVQLWDSEEQVIYLKSADASGMPTMKILDYTIRDGQNQTVQQEITENTSFATKKELSDIKKQLETLKKQIESRVENEQIVRNDE